MNHKGIEIASGMEISYRESGQGSPLIFLHAFPLASAMWEKQIETFSATHRVIAPDARGFGGSDGFRENETPSILQMARDLNALLDALQIEEEIILCGLSMGGYIALAFAREYSQRLRALILCDTRAEADTPEARAKRSENIAFLESHDSAAFIGKMLPNLLGETTRRDNSGVVETVRVLASSQSAKACRDALRAMRDRPNRSDELEDIGVPTLVVAGNEDGIIPIEVARATAAKIANARCEIVTGAGHLSNLENAAQFNAVSREFLDDF